MPRATTRRAREGKRRKVHWQKEDAHSAKALAANHGIDTTSRKSSHRDDGRTSPTTKAAARACYSPRTEQTAEQWRLAISRYFVADFADYLEEWCDLSEGAEAWYEGRAEELLDYIATAAPPHRTTPHGWCL